MAIFVQPMQPPLEQPLGGRPSGPIYVTLVECTLFDGSPRPSMRKTIIDLPGGKLVTRPDQFLSSPVEVLQGCLRISIWGGWGLAGWRRLLNNIVITGTNLHQLGPSPVQGFKGLGWNFPAFRRCLRGCFFLGFHYKNRGFNIIN